jgi:hypothetical protein
MSRTFLSRRDWLRLSALGVAGYSMSGWLENLANAAAAHPLRKRSCILLWMNGGPSQMDTFDLKPGHANGGPFKEIATSAPGLKISEHLPKVAKFGHKMAVLRSMTTKEGDHGRASFLLRTGYLPQGPFQYPTLGSLLSKELGRADAPLPNFVSIAPYRQFSPAAYGPGFLGPMHAPLIVGENSGAVGAPGGPGAVDYGEVLKVQDLAPSGPVSAEHVDARLDLLRDLEKDFSSERPDAPPRGHKAAYDRAVRLMRTAAARAFKLEDETDRVRDAYGRNLFGQGCLLARRLVERGVAFVEVTLGGLNGGAFGWDTHNNNFDQVRQLSGVLDPAWGTLMSDLQERGLLDSTLIVWMGEFGRTPRINPQQGRDHYPNAWSTVLAGGGIKGGQAYGKTSADGMTVAEKPVTVPDLLATVCKALGIDPDKPNMSGGRPIRIVEKGGKPITDIAG